MAAPLNLSWLAQARDRSVARVSGKRWLLILAIAVALLLGAAGFGLLVVLPGYVEGRVLTTAAANGISLKPAKVSFGWGWVQITQVQVNLDGVRSVQMQVGRIDVALDRLTPLSIELSNVEGVVTGSISNVGLELSAWTRAHPSAYSLPLSAKNVRVRFVDPAGSPPWLDVSGGVLTRTASGGAFSASHTEFLGVDLGKVGAGFSREASAIALGFGQSDLTQAPFRVEVKPAATPPTATFSLVPTAAELLARPLGIGLLVSGVTVAAETTIAFGTGVAEGSVTGNTHVTLKGYVPPHPFELDGFIFGDTTTFSTKFALPKTRDRITLMEASLQAGRFELHGDGLLVRSPDHSEINVKLHGDLPCSSFAAVEAESRLSKILSGSLLTKAGKLAEKMASGSVSVGIELSADTRHLGDARIDRKIGIGCGLHPLSFAELNKLFPLPPEINALLQNLPALPTDLSKIPGMPAGLPTSLPPLPSGLPALPAGLPQLPNLGLPTSLPTSAPPKTGSTATSAPAGASKAAPKPAASGGG